MVVVVTMSQIDHDLTIAKTSNIVKTNLRILDLHCFGAELFLIGPAPCVRAQEECKGAVQLPLTRG